VYAADPENRNSRLPAFIIFNISGRNLMLENLDLSKSLDKQNYKEWMPKLRQELWRLQRQSLEAKMPVIVVFEGWDAA
jgi:polyphosphate kinase 2 (PPK2 family)